MTGESKGRLFVEKRKHKRVYKQYDVRYKIMPKEVTSQSSKFPGKSLDLSTGGIRVEGEVIGSENDIMRLEIDTGSGDHIVVFAEIRWIRREAGSIGQFGLQFMALKEEDLEAINRIIAENEQV